MSPIPLPLPVAGPRAVRRTAPALIAIALVATAMPVLIGSHQPASVHPASHHSPSDHPASDDLASGRRGGEQTAAGTPAGAPPAGSTAAAREDRFTRDERFTRADGGIVRGPRDAKRIALTFTGHEFAEGGEAILDTLAARRARASFFLTGVFLRTPAHAPLVRRMLRDGHLVGPHSDQHLLLCPWTGPKESLVTRAQFDDDLRANVAALAPFGVDASQVTFYLPSYEWYNADHVTWSRALGLTLVNFTPGTRSNADYMEDGAKGFVSSEAILQSILRREQEDPDGLNGFILLLHVGAGPKRTDKMAARLPALLDALTARGYTFVRVDDLLVESTRAR